ncbi:MAG: DUF1593 domain-containing protein [Ruminococcaceae bacterium]|nr:DUF1593 domain-containing protein [Oscillospiraceae bacterium]
MEKARVIVLTDIGPWDAEPDDAQSLVRLMLYSNEYDIEGIIPNASWCGPDTSDDGYIQRIVDVVKIYGEVRDNLASHADGYPSVDSIMSKIKRGTAYVNMKRRDLKLSSKPSPEEKLFAIGRYAGDTSAEKNIGVGLSNEGSDLIINSLRNNDPRPLWILLWGGCGTLAQALHDLMTADEDEAHCLAQKLRVYDIHGQDDCGAWICKNFPEIKWHRATTSFWGFSESPARWGYNIGSIECVKGAWLEKNIRRGPFARVYPHTHYGLETDSPSILAMIPNGLTNRDHLEWGGWAGRFSRIPFPDVPAEFFTKTYLYEEKGYRMYKDETDTYTYSSTGTVFKDTFASVERWKEDYQNDMAARIEWTLTSDRSACCHNPIAVLNGDQTKDEVIINAKAGDDISPDLSGSYDPDGNTLRYRWYCYGEAGTYNGDITIYNPNSPNPTIHIPPNAEHEEIHIIAEVSNHGHIPLKSYRRLIIRTGSTGIKGSYSFVNDDMFTYEGNWTHEMNQFGCLYGDCHVSSEAKSTATLKFSGCRIMLIANAYETNGIAKINIDGKEYGTVDFYSQFKHPQNQYVVNGATSVYTTQYLSPYFENGEHTLIITVTREKNLLAKGSDIIIDGTVIFE